MVGKFDKFQLNGKTALITGGAGLLGVQHAWALGECGARVLIADINPDAAEKAAESLRQELETDAFHAIQLDVTSLASIRDNEAELRTRYGGVQILVNNASVDPKVKKGGSGLASTGRFEDFSLERWHFEVDVGLTGAFLCSQVFGKAMADNGGGAILNIASDLSIIAPDQRIYRKPGVPETEQPVKPVTYSVIKTGLIGLTRYLAAYWADKQVRVNALSPGGVYTEQPEDFVQRLSQLIPLGRMARADEYRCAVQFLCSEASSYLTGQNIVMDGGRSIL